MDYKQKSPSEKEALKKAKKEWKQDLYAKYPDWISEGYSAEEIWKANLSTKNI